MASSPGEIDPVCGMTVDPASAPASVEHAGKSYHFCCPSCAQKFQADPERYLRGGARPEHMDAPPPAAPAGGAIEYICPMDPEIVRDRPGSCPKCGMALEQRVASAVEGRLAGLLGVIDPIRASTLEAIRLLHADGLRIVMLTGDNRTTAEAVARRLGIDEVIAEVLPAQKRAVVARLHQQGHIVAMAGDGSNDAPALARAQVGIAMGGGQADQVRVESHPTFARKGKLPKMIADGLAVLERVTHVRAPAQSEPANPSNISSSVVKVINRPAVKSASASCLRRSQSIGGGGVETRANASVKRS
jgi:YHS domain-containing protein/soluble P-type ATPase